MRIIDLALKDLSQILRDRKSLLFIVAMPVVFTLFMGFAYSGNSGGEKDTRIPLAVAAAQPDDPLAQRLIKRLTSSDAVRVIPLAEAGAMEALRKGDVAGVLRIPAGFAGLAQQGGTAQLTLVADSTTPAGQSLYQLLRVPVTQIFSAVEVGRISVEAQGGSAEYGPAFDLAWEKWNAAAGAPLIRSELAVAAESSDWTGGNPYNQASPGILVMFAIFGLVTSAQILVQERKTRTLQRLMTTAMRPWEILCGHLLAMFALCFLQCALLIVFGQLALGVNYLREPVGTLLISMALSLWVAAIGLLIGVLAQRDDQVILFSLVAMFLSSALGGVWFPLEGTGGVFAAIGRLMPSAWAMTGYQNLLIRGLEFNAMLLPAGILAGYGLLFLAAAIWAFRRMQI